MIQELSKQEVRLDVKDIIQSRSESWVNRIVLRFMRGTKLIERI